MECSLFIPLFSWGKKSYGGLAGVGYTGITVYVWVLSRRYLLNHSTFCKLITIAQV